MCYKSLLIRKFKQCKSLSQAGVSPFVELDLLQAIPAPSPWTRTKCNKSCKHTKNKLILQKKCSLVCRIVKAPLNKLRWEKLCNLCSRRENKTKWWWDRGSLPVGMILCAQYSRILVSSRQLAEILKQDLIRFISVCWKDIFFSHIFFKPTF